MLRAALPPVLGIPGLFAAYRVCRLIHRHPAGAAKVTDIGDPIHLGLVVCMRRDFKALGMFGVIVLGLLLLFLGLKAAIALLVGVLALGRAGYYGMYTATHANVRTTTAADRKVRRR